MGETVRRNEDDPMKEVIMNGDTWNIPVKGENRVGHPSTNWPIETANQAWIKHQIDKHNHEQIKIMGVVKRNRTRKSDKTDKIEKERRRKSSKRKISAGRETRVILNGIIEGWTSVTNKEKKS